MKNFRSKVLNCFGASTLCCFLFTSLSVANATEIANVKKVQEDTFTKKVISLPIDSGKGRIFYNGGQEDALKLGPKMLSATLIDGEIGTDNDGGFLYSSPTSLRRLKFVSRSVGMKKTCS